MIDFMKYREKIGVIVKISAIYRWKSDISTTVSAVCRACGNTLTTAFKSCFIIDLSANSEFIGYILVEILMKYRCKVEEIILL